MFIALIYFFTPKEIRREVGYLMAGELVIEACLLWSLVS